jgi:hypothetical protein
MSTGPILRFDGDFIVDGQLIRTGLLTGIDAPTAQAAAVFGWQPDAQFPSKSPATVNISRYGPNLPEVRT